MEPTNKNILQSKDNSAVLYGVIHDFLRENETFTQDIVAILETIKLEIVIDALNTVMEDDEDD